MIGTEIIHGECRLCHEQTGIIDGIEICGRCVLDARNKPGISPETRDALKWLLNVQYGAMKTTYKRVSNDFFDSPLIVDINTFYSSVVKTLGGRVATPDDPRAFGSIDPDRKSVV